MPRGAGLRDGASVTRGFDAVLHRPQRLQERLDDWTRELKFAAAMLSAAAAERLGLMPVDFSQACCNCGVNASIAPFTPKQFQPAALAPVSNPSETAAMSQYSIWVMEYAYVSQCAVSSVIYGAHNQGIRKLPYCYVLIKSGDHIAMVDVGYNDKEYGRYISGKFGVENCIRRTTVRRLAASGPKTWDRSSLRTPTSTTWATSRLSRTPPSTFRSANSRSGSGPCRSPIACAT